MGMSKEALVTRKAYVNKWKKDTEDYWERKVKELQENKQCSN